MSGSVTSHLPFLQMLVKANKKRRQALIQTMSRTEVNFLCEAVLNAIAGEGRGHLTPECRQRCARHKRLIRELAFNHRLGWQKRKTLLVNQSGSGWFLPLLGAVLSLLTTQT